MGKHEKLRDEFNNELTGLMNAYKEKSASLSREGLSDEANLERIKYNIADIFYKMFNISYNNVYVKLNNPNIINVIASIDDNYAKLFAAYMYFFDTIPSPWIEKRDKARSFGKDIECIIEEIKISLANDFKQKFVEKYEKYRVE